MRGPLWTAGASADTKASRDELDANLAHLGDKPGRPEEQASGPGKRHRHCQEPSLRCEEAADRTGRSSTATADCHTRRVQPIGGGTV